VIRCLTHSTPLTNRAGGEKLKKAKSAVGKLEKEIAEGETDAAKKAVQVRVWFGCCFTQGVKILGSGWVACLVVQARQ